MIIKLPKIERSVHLMCFIIIFILYTFLQFGHHPFGAGSPTPSCCHNDALVFSSAFYGRLNVLKQIFICNKNNLFGR